MTKKKPGGQPSNTNALKAGIYSRRFTPLQLSDLETEVRQGLESEIIMLRVQCQRLVDFSSGENEKGALVETLNTLGTAFTKLANLIRTQQSLHSRTTEVASILSQALTEFWNEHKIHP